MKQRLCIGIQHLTPAWSTLLHQLGVWFEEVDYANSLNRNYSVIIINKKPDESQIQLLNEYLQNKGAVLEIKGTVVFNDKSRIQSSSVKTLIDYSEKEAFRHIPFLDLYSTIEKHQDSNLLDGLVHFQSLAKGTVGFFGTDVSILLHKPGYVRKRFFSKQGKHPDEIVNKVSKHKLMDAFGAALKELHFREAKPFIQKWSSPVNKPVFCFRIDSDFGDKKSINELYSVIESQGISATWFLHVEAHETWLEHFHSFKNQEIALHGYKHGTSSSPAKIQENIRIGKYLLEQAGFELSGFCAPYGIWNKGLRKAMRAFDFTYTSEFTFGYDGFPFQPLGSRLPLQIPIHPICTGSLDRQQYSSDEMKTYFEQVIQNILARYEPAMFYHHPLQPGLNVIGHLFEWVNSHGLQSMTFKDFADFWVSRQNHSFQAEYENGQIEILKNSDPNKFFQVSRNHSHFQLAQSSDGEIDLTNTPEFEYSNSYLPDAEEVAKMRQKDFRVIKTSLLDWKNRIRL